MSTPAASALTPLVDELLIFSNYYHPEPTGSAPPISDLSFWAAEQGLKPTVITARPSYPKPHVHEGYEKGQRDREIYRGVTIRRVPSIVPRSRGTAGRLVAELSFAVSALFARPRAFNGVVCVCPSIFVVLVAPLFRRRGGRLVAIVHDIQSGLAQSLNFGGGGAVIALLRRLEAWSLNRCDTVIVLSDAMEHEVRALGVHRPIAVIPPQVDVKEIQPGPEPAEAKPVLLYSGNLGRKQGLDQVLQLARRLKARNRSALIHIRGEGSERAELEAEAAADGLTNVRFSNLAPREDLSNALAEATLHLVPQNPAGASFALPSKVFSIMAARRAFVATAAAGTPLEMVTTRSGGGLCIPAEDADLFADTVERLLDDPAARQTLAAAGRRYVETEIDREVVCKAILTLAASGEGAA